MISKSGLSLATYLWTWVGIASLACLSARAEPAPTGHINVLFIGNSFTFYHDMPQMFRQLAAAAGKDLNVDEFVQGGQTLDGFWHDPKQEALQRIKSKPWDFLVLEGWNDPAMDMRTWGTQLMDEMRKVNPKATVLMYMVHPANPYPDDATMDSQQGQYEDLATARPYAILVPVEWAWKKGFTDDPSPANWQAEDKWHPGPRRSYIAAVSMFATIYQQTPLGLGNKTIYPGDVDLKPEDASYLQSLAWDALRSHSTFTGFFNPPHATLTAPSADSSQAAGTPIKLEVQLKPGDAPIQRVEFANQLGKLGEVASAPYSFVWSDAPIGKFDLTATPIDSKGLSRTSKPIFMTVTGSAKTSDLANFAAGDASGWTLSGIGIAKQELEGGAWNVDVKGICDKTDYTGDYIYQCAVQCSGDNFRSYNLVFNYKDDSNYYCLSVKGGGTSKPELKMLVDGKATTLATSTASVSPLEKISYSIHFSYGFITVKARQGETSQDLIVNYFDKTFSHGKVGFLSTGGMPLKYSNPQISWSAPMAPASSVK